MDLDDNHQVGIGFWPDGNTASGGQGQTIQGLACGLTGTTFHIHAHLSILVDGQAYAVPAMGIVNPRRAGQCTYPVHTHDRSGKIHIEAASPFTATLGQIFAIWGQPLASDNVAGIVGLPITVYVIDNGTVTRVEGDWAAVELASHRHVAIVIGRRVDQLPFFTWSAN